MKEVDGCIPKVSHVAQSVSSALLSLSEETPSPHPFLQTSNMHGFFYKERPWQREKRGNRVAWGDDSTFSNTLVRAHGCAEK